MNGRASRPVGAVILATLAMAVTLVVGGPRPAVAQEEDALLVTWQTADGSTFTAVVTDQESIARIEAAFPGDGQAGIPNGPLAPGDGGVNAPHAWHLVDVVVVDITIELCDATAAMIDEDLDYWLNTVGTFCPWTATVVAVEPYRAVPTLPDTGSGGTTGTAARPWLLEPIVAGALALGCGLGWRRLRARTAT